MPESFNILCRDNGESILVVQPGTGCRDVIGVGHAGNMSYYRVTYNQKYALKINKTTVSSNGLGNPSSSLYDALELFSGCSRGWEFARNIMRRVKPTQNPFTPSFLADNPMYA
jgi:hypothetical protein